MVELERVYAEEDRGDGGKRVTRVVCDILDTRVLIQGNDALPERDGALVDDPRDVGRRGGERDAPSKGQGAARGGGGQRQFRVISGSIMSVYSVLFTLSGHQARQDARWAGGSAQLTRRLRRCSVQQPSQPFASWSWVRRQEAGLPS